MESSSPDHHGSGEDSIRALAVVFGDQGAKVATATGVHRALPEVSVGDRFYPEIEEFFHTAGSTLGVDLSLLRCLDHGELEKGRPRLYSLATNHADDYLNDGYCWMDSEDVELIGGLSESQKSAIQLERTRISGLAPDMPVAPWEWPGRWDCELREWISGHLGSRAVSGDWTVTPVRSWSISSVVRISIGAAGLGERFYFKASPTFFSKEAAVTAAVAERFPEVSPGLVAVDRTRGWMLMEDLGDRTIGDVDGADIWHEAMRALASIHIGFAEDHRSLDRLGLERRSISDINSTFRRWICDSHGLGLHYVAERTQSALARLEPHIELVDQLCHFVESIGLPQTLAHGDLDAGNVFVREGVPAIMDWSDVSISSPLFDPALIPQVTGNPILARAYLDEWTEFASMERLEDAFEAARPIAALERAFHYHRNIVAHLTYPSVDLRILEEYIPDLLNLAASRLEEYG